MKKSLSTINKPNSKFDHVFAIVRIDIYLLDSDHIENAFTVTKILKTQEMAQKEVERLNKLNEDKGSIYFWQITRLERE